MNHHAQSNGTRRIAPIALIEPLECREYFSVDLAASVLLVVPRTDQVKTGSAVVLSVEISNQGTTTATGALAIDLGISPNSDGSSAIAFTPLSRHVNLKAGAHTTMRFSEKVAFGTAPGSYYGVVQIDPNNVFGDTNIANNFAVSANTIVVSPKYLNLVGTWTGEQIIKAGYAKGETDTSVVVITSEDPATGKFTFSGTNYLTGGGTLEFAGTGSISPSGVYNETAEDVPADQFRTAHIHGKIVGDVNTYTFRNALNSGAGTVNLPI